MFYLVRIGFSVIAIKGLLLINLQFPTSTYIIYLQEL